MLIIHHGDIFILIQEPLPVRLVRTIIGLVLLDYWFSFVRPAPLDLHLYHASRDFTRGCLAPRVPIVRLVTSHVLLPLLAPFVLRVRTCSVCRVLAACFHVYSSAGVRSLRSPCPMGTMSLHSASSRDGFAA